MRNVGLEHCWLVSARNLDGFVQDPWAADPHHPPTHPPNLPRCLNHTSFAIWSSCRTLSSGRREMSIIPQLGILILSCCLGDRYSKLSSHSQSFQGCTNLLSSLMWDQPSLPKIRWSEFVMELKHKWIVLPLPSWSHSAWSCFVLLFCPNSTHVAFHGVWGRPMMQLSMHFSYSIQHLAFNALFLFNPTFAPRLPAQIVSVVHSVGHCSGTIFQSKAAK